MPQHIGIVACSAEGAALCYRTICTEAPAILGTHDHPEVTMHTPSLGEYMDHIYRGDWPAVGAMMLGSAEKLAEFRRKNEHFRDFSFDSISGAGPNGAVVHYKVSEKSSRKVEMNSIYLIDSGGQYLDGTTDITRTVAVGTPTAEMKAWPW